MKLQKQVLKFSLSEEEKKQLSSEGIASLQGACISGVS
jgi:hypothetical protein